MTRLRRMSRTLPCLPPSPRSRELGRHSGERERNRGPEQTGKGRRMSACVCVCGMVCYCSCLLFEFKGVETQSVVHEGRMLTFCPVWIRVRGSCWHRFCMYMHACVPPRVTVSSMVPRLYASSLSTVGEGRRRTSVLSHAGCAPPAGCEHQEPSYTRVGSPLFWGSPVSKTHHEHHAKAPKHGHSLSFPRCLDAKWHVGGASICAPGSFSLPSLFGRVDRCV